MILHTNEGISAFNRAPTAPSYIASVPEDLDMISIDYYNTTDPPAEAPQVISMYQKYIFPRLHAHQSVTFVPGTVGCIPGSVCDWSACTPPGHAITWGQCNASIHAQDLLLTEKIKAYYDYALTDSRVAGFCPWHWFGSRVAFPTEPQ